ncbi:MMPL family transporter [Streptomyces sp. NPDC006235]|uniref:MMPL family transporter n=1 Tax=Streptomyces sp. NPDC006235 TaxID=3156736 RepID=UPI0033A13F6B
MTLADSADTVSALVGAVGAAGVFTAGLPLVTMAQMGVLVGIGVLLDTFLVRTVLVPALALDLGRWWWPGGLSRARPAARNAPGSTPSPTPQDPTRVA